MVLRRIIAYYFVNNEQIIEKLANWRPLRATARFTAYLYLKGKARLEQVDWEQLIREFRRRLK